MFMRIMAFIAVVGVGQALFTTPDGLQVVEQTDRLVYKWHGKVAADMLEQLKTTFAKHTKDRRPIVLSLDSGGGSVQQGSKIITFILNMQTTHTVNTLVEDGATCASMCVPIYLAGARRSASPSARFMFHEVSFAPVVDHELRKLRATHPQINVGQAKKYLIDRGTDNLFERYLVTAGANEKWMNQMRKSVRGKDVWRSGQDLVAERSGIVHTLY